MQTNKAATNVTAPEMTSIKKKFEDIEKKISFSFDNESAKGENGNVLEAFNKGIEEIMNEYNTVQPLPGNDSRTAIINGMLAYHSHMLLNKVLATIPNTEEGKKLLESNTLAEFYDAINTNARECKESVRTSPLNYIDMSTALGKSSALEAISKEPPITQLYEDLQKKIRGEDGIQITLNSADIKPSTVPKIAMLLQINDPEQTARCATAVEIRKDITSPQGKEPYAINYDSNTNTRKKAFALKYVTAAAAAAATGAALFFGTRALSKLIAPMKVIPHVLIISAFTVGVTALVKKAISKVTHKSKSPMLPNITSSNVEVKGFSLPIPEFEQLGDSVASKTFGAQKSENLKVAISNEDFKKITSNLKNVTRVDTEMKVALKESQNALVTPKKSGKSI
ncbi:hypothetical protein [Candidatus Fokinia crypta]|nr:hypothetical protein [Candidatus Fokinia cryptica]